MISAGALAKCAHIGHDGQKCMNVSERFNELTALCDLGCLWWYLSGFHWLFRQNAHTLLNMVETKCKFSCINSIIYFYWPHKLICKYFVVKYTVRLLKCILSPSIHALSICVLMIWRHYENCVNGFSNFLRTQPQVPGKIST